MMALLLLCSWMNEATASGILGGQATAAATHSSCEFWHEADRLRIEVFAPADAFRSYLKRCKGPVEALKAIGNEAVVCDGEDSTQVVIGRVRDQVFVLQLKSSFGKVKLQEKVKLAAEIVSGNLF